MESNKKWYKNEPNDKIWWLDNGDETTGEFIFSFDRKKQYNLYVDYPHNMTVEEVAIFDEENPFWADYFSERKA